MCQGDPIGGRYFSRYNGGHLKAKKIIKIFIKCHFYTNGAGGQCVKHIMWITAKSSHCIEITGNIFRKYKAKQSEIK